MNAAPGPKPPPRSCARRAATPKTSHAPAPRLWPTSATPPGTCPAAARLDGRLCAPTGGSGSHHTAGTSEVLAGAYPFLAEGGLGADGTFIGQDAWSGGGFCFDPWVLYQNGTITNPNCLLAGVVGRGKSMLAKAMATRSIATGRKVYVPGDPKGEWSIVARAVGGVAIELGGGSTNRLNPLAGVS